MSTESTARTPLPYRFVRLWVSTIVVCSMTIKLGSAVRHVVSREIDLSSHPQGGFPFGRSRDRLAKQLALLQTQELLELAQRPVDAIGCGIGDWDHEQPIECGYHQRSQGVRIKPLVHELVLLSVANEGPEGYVPSLHHLTG